MGATRRASVILVAVLAGLILVPPLSAQLFRLREHSLRHDGMDRKYLVYTPRAAGRLAGERALVLVLHGGGGTHRGMVGQTLRRFNKLADRDGFYVVYPNAINKSWDFGEGKVSEAHEVRVDDEGFFRKLIERLERDLPIDPDRIFATGISRGGQASYFLACKFPGTIRAIAPVTMPLPGFLEDDCRKGPPVGVAVLNGTADPLVPYNGGEISLFHLRRGKVLSTDKTVKLWKKRNGCSAEVKVDSLPDRENDGIRVERSAWTDCSGAPVVLYRIVGGGHTWPSGKQYLPASLVGLVARDIDGAEEIWSFFESFD